MPPLPGALIMRGMDWEVHYQSGSQQLRVPAANRSAAIAIASILLRDGHEVVKLVSAAGDTIKTEEIRRLCGR
jgi:hypothetical protein